MLQSGLTAVDISTTMNLMATTRNRFTYKSHWTPLEMQDGAHCGGTSYDVYEGHTFIGQLEGNEQLVDPDNEGRGWVTVFTFQGAKGTRYGVGDGSTRAAAIIASEPIAEVQAECDWCYSTRVIDWQGAEAPCPVCSNGPAEARPL